MIAQLEYIDYSDHFIYSDEILEWEEIVVKLELRRNLPYYVYRIYVPCILLMIFTMGKNIAAHRF